MFNINLKLTQTEILNIIDNVPSAKNRILDSLEWEQSDYIEEFLDVRDMLYAELELEYSGVDIGSDEWNQYEQEISDLYERYGFVYGVLDDCNKRI